MISRFRELGAAALLAVAGCAREEPGNAAAGGATHLVLAAYSAPREALEHGIIPAFEADYRARTGRQVKIEASYQASGAQTRAVLGGFEADVVALALDGDVEAIRKGGLIRGDFRAGPTRGVFADSVVALAVRPGNPKGLHSFADLARPGLEVLMPNPKTSGGAMWNVNALYGAALRGHAGVPAGDPAAAEGYLRVVLRNVLIMDKGARESMITFEKGVGDVAITYESELAAARLAGREVDEVIPRSSILVEAMMAVVDVNADKHGVRAAADAFVAFSLSPAAQGLLTKYGFRPVDPGLAPETERAFPPAVDVFRIDALGGWEKAKKDLYSPGGVFPRAWDAVTSEP